MIPPQKVTDINWYPWPTFWQQHNLTYFNIFKVCAFWQISKASCVPFSMLQRLNQHRSHGPIFSRYLTDCSWPALAGSDVGGGGFLGSFLTDPFPHPSCMVLLLEDMVWQASTYLVREEGRGRAGDGEGWGRIHYLPAWREGQDGSPT